MAKICARAPSLTSTRLDYIARVINSWTLRSDDLVRRVVAVNRLKLCLLVLASGLGLLALAVLIVLANAVVLVSTLAIVGTVLFLLGRSALAEGRRTNAGR